MYENSSKRNKMCYQTKMPLNFVTLFSDIGQYCRPAQKKTVLKISNSIALGKSKDISGSRKNMGALKSKPKQGIKD